MADYGYRAELLSKSCQQLLICEILEDMPLHQPSLPTRHLECCCVDLSLQ